MALQEEKGSSRCESSIQKNYSLCSGLGLLRFLCPFAEIPFIKQKVNGELLPLTRTCRTPGGLLAAGTWP